ncbi:hypothetical protein L1987_41211 [Smallanthus sonchifolius]|uniref:Uncharacterized protein n=1 Tax=Smallanthus sonchifolius TaxID=185202 RepID=A0ACB9GUB7_9ASTR|nr:hypothetical protein L1987_41211 [Smallanthus sonchifolius]
MRKKVTFFICPKLSYYTFFLNLGPLELHGFDDPPPLPPGITNKVFIDLILRPTKEDLKIWPHSFEYPLRITLGAGSDLIFRYKLASLKLRMSSKCNRDIPFENHLVILTQEVDHGIVTYLEKVGFLTSNLLATHTVKIGYLSNYGVKVGMLLKQLYISISKQMQASRSTRLQRILEETKEAHGESEIRDRMQILCS